MSGRAFGWGVAVVVAGLVAAADTASGIPRFAANTGAHCSRCHVNPTGGGARNRYGHNVYASHELTMELVDREPVLNAEFPLGAPVTVGLGADVRIAYHWRAAREAPDADRSTFFPMQTDLYVHADVGPYVTVYLDRGFSNFEAFGMVHDRGTDFWAKAGQFVLPYGLRLANHSAYIRGRTGFDPRAQYYGLDTGVEGGASVGPVRFIAAVANGRHPLQGGTVLFDDNTHKAVVATVDWAYGGPGLRVRAGASGYSNFAGRRTVDVVDGEIRLQTDDRLKVDQLAAFATLSTGRVTLVNEADLFRRRDYESEPETLEETIARTTGIATYHQLSARVVQGADLKATWEYLDPELDAEGQPTHRIGVGAELFPMTGWEWQLLYRHTFQVGSDGDEFLTYVHFYF